MMGHACPEGGSAKQKWRRWEERVRNACSQLRSAAGRARCGSAPSDGCFRSILLWLHFKSSVSDSWFGGFVQIHLTGFFLHNRVDLFSCACAVCGGGRLLWIASSSAESVGWRSSSARVPGLRSVPAVRAAISDSTMRPKCIWWWQVLWWKTD